MNLSVCKICGYEQCRCSIEDIRRVLNKPEPAPVKSIHPAVWDLVLNDMVERDAMGKRRYGTRLQPFNGRDPMIDLYQELLDAAVYCRQAIYERDMKEKKND